jgi:5'-3' exonuclease
MLALIDQDLLCYRCAASAENEEVSVAIGRIDELLDQILEKTKATEYRAFLSGPSNFRKTIYPEYKANRTQPKPKWLVALREYSLERLGAELAPEQLEADDALGINQTSNTIICSLDKDLLQIPGKHFQWAISGPNWEKPDTFYEIDELAGLKAFYKQCLKGDVSDNIKGVEGIGDKKAEKLLAECTTEQEMFDKVRDTYGNDEEFLMNARCLYILRHFEDDFKFHFERMANGNNSDATSNSDDN